ncbi:MAG: hypothetical protein HQL49_06055 [Gammaproteobacteria bacterium]|nr:hypothetical protein [Gammaproteobacteria bacterium]
MAETDVFPADFNRRCSEYLESLYGKKLCTTLTMRLRGKLVAFKKMHEQPTFAPWSERDAIIVTYGDSICRDKHPLQTLNYFLSEPLQGLVSTVHILPYFPASTDNEYAISDYRAVASEYGSWYDIERIGEQFNLMTDLIINHVSRENSWFLDFVNGFKPGCDFFIEIEEEHPLCGDAEHRPLVTEVQTKRGRRHLWSSFSHNQFDLNYKNPQLLFEMVDILLFYLGKGSRFIRLEAVEYIWKEQGTSCVNQPQTHTIVKLLRLLMQSAAPGSRLVTQTDLPTVQTCSYFGAGDESQLVYQQPIPALLLYTLHSGDSSDLTRYLASHQPPPDSCSYLNCLTSPEGFLLQPLNDLLPNSAIDNLLHEMRQRGGIITMRANAATEMRPYSLNIPLVDAFAAGGDHSEAKRLAAAIAAHTILLTLRGIPTFYIEGFTVASRNGSPLADKRSHAHGRFCCNFDTLIAQLQQQKSLNAQLFSEVKRLLTIRQKYAVFHPEAAQQSVAAGDKLFALWRFALDGQSSLLALGNPGEATLTATLPANLSGKSGHELLSDTTLTLPATLPIDPYTTLWLWFDHKIEA